MNKFIYFLLSAVLFVNYGTKSIPSNHKDMAYRTVMPTDSTDITQTFGDRALDLREAIDIRRYNGRNASDMNNILHSIAVDELNFSPGTSYLDSLYRNNLYSDLMHVKELKLAKNDTIYCYVSSTELVVGGFALTAYSVKDSIAYSEYGDKSHIIPKKFALGEYLRNWDSGIDYDAETYRLFRLPPPSNLDFRVIIRNSKIERVDGFSIEVYSKSLKNEQTDFDRSKIIEIKEVVPSPHIPQNNSSIIKRDSVNTK